MKSVLWNVRVLSTGIATWLVVGGCVGLFHFDYKLVHVYGLPLIVIDKSGFLRIVNDFIIQWPTWQSLLYFASIWLFAYISIRAIQQKFVLPLIESDVYAHSLLGRHSA